MLQDASLAERVVGKIIKLASRVSAVKICHACGAHEWTITHFGLIELLPSSVEVIAGPSCPVCIVPSSEIDEAVELALKGVVIDCFGDVLRVLGSHMSLLDAKAEGADVKVVYNTGDAVKIAKKKLKEFTVFAVGFETTTPPTAIEILAN